ncbi:hypothetical protein MAL1_00178 [Bacteriophage DSS3_MAL1]|nr:hypothetical protein MAL1_00178 [Bacteriophage DSS3_MAL1]
MLINLKKPTAVPMVLDVLEEHGFVTEAAKARILRAYVDDIAAAEERGRMEACDIMEELMGKARKGGKA